MSDLFRKEALENRSRALYGEVTLQNSLGNWVLTLIIVAIFLIGLGFLLGVKIETDEGAMRLLHWLIAQAQ